MRRARSASCVRGEDRQKIQPHVPHTIVQAVPAFKYERGYLTGYFKLHDPRMFFQDVTRSHTVI